MLTKRLLQLKDFFYDLIIDRLFKTMEALLTIPRIPKMLVVFLTLFGVWGFGSYKVPKFFTWLTSNIPFLRKFFQFVFMLVLAYQGLGSQDFALSFWSTLVFFTIFEIVKLLENQFWHDEAEEEAAPPAPSVAVAAPVTLDPAALPTKEEFRNYYSY